MIIFNLRKRCALKILSDLKIKDTLIIENRDSIA